MDEDQLQCRNGSLANTSHIELRVEEGVLFATERRVLVGSVRTLKHQHFVRNVMLLSVWVSALRSITLILVIDTSVHSSVLATASYCDTSLFAMFFETYHSF